MVFEANLRVADVMGEAVTCAQDSTLREAANLMNAKEARGVVIVDGSATIGILTETDFVEKLAAAGRQFRNNAGRRAHDFAGDYHCAGRNAGFSW